MLVVDDPYLLPFCPKFDHGGHKIAGRGWPSMAIQAAGSNDEVLRVSRRMLLGRQFGFRVDSRGGCRCGFNVRLSRFGRSSEVSLKAPALFSIDEGLWVVWVPAWY